MKNIMQLENGQIIKAKLGRHVEHKLEPDWEYEGEIVLHIQKNGKEIVNITPKNYEWAEYLPEDFDRNSNEFAIEGWHMRVLNWNL